MKIFTHLNVYVKKLRLYSLFILNKILIIIITLNYYYYSFLTKNKKITFLQRYINVHIFFTVY